jgi:hypothetical protein
MRSGQRPPGVGPPIPNAELAGLSLLDSLPEDTFPAEDLESVSPVLIRQEDLPGRRGTMRGRSYEDGSVEILQTDSRDERVSDTGSPNLVSPEKDVDH